MIKTLLLTLLLGGSLFAQNDASINLNESDIELRTTIDLGSQVDRYSKTKHDSYFLSLGFLNVEDTEGNINNILVSSGFKLRQDIQGVPGLRLGFGIGLKGIEGNLNGEQFLASPLGLELNYILPLNNIMPISFSASLDYANSALCYLEARSFIETRLESSIRIMDNGELIVGYRRINTEYLEAGSISHTINPFYIGFNVKF